MPYGMQTHTNLGMGVSFTLNKGCTHCNYSLKQFNLKLHTHNILFLLWFSDCITYTLQLTSKTSPLLSQFFFPVALLKFLVYIRAMVPPLFNIISIMFITCFKCAWNCSITTSLTVYLLWQTFSLKYYNFYSQTRGRAREVQGGHVLNANKNGLNWPIKRC